MWRTAYSSSHFHEGIHCTPAQRYTAGLKVDPAFLKQLFAKEERRKVTTASILSEYRVSASDESESCDNRREFFAPRSVRIWGDARLLCPDARSVEETNRVQGCIRRIARARPGLAGSVSIDVHTDVQVQYLPRASTTR